MATPPLKGSPLVTNGFHDNGMSARAARYATRSTNQPRCTIELEKVIGNTVTNSKGFDSLIDGTYAVCSGSTAVVNKIYSDSDVRQRLFRAPARSNAETMIGTESPAATPSRTRGRSVPRPSILASGVLSPDAKDSPGKAVHKKPKGISCLAFSPDGQYLAVGETGYGPRILLFSLNSESEGSVSIVAEHISGIQTLAFSTDSRRLCSVGDIYDGYIYLWSINSKGTMKLHSSSKCTSSIHDTKWIDKRTIVTAGVRHLKVWRPELPSPPPSPLKTTYPPRRIRQDSPLPGSPGPKGLPGRNVLLNELLDCVFTSVCPLGCSKALVGSDTGDLSIINAENGTQKLERLINIGSPIRCLSLDTRLRFVHIATADGHVVTCDQHKILDPNPVEVGDFSKNLAMQSPPIALGVVSDHLLYVDEQRRISSFRKQGRSLHPTLNSGARSYQSAHSVAVNGALRSGSATTGQLLTYDASGHLVIWSTRLDSVREYNLLVRSSCDEDDINELKVVRKCSETGIIVCGDKFGCLDLLDAEFQVLDQAQAHAGEINDIVLMSPSGFESLIVTCGRDRIIQTFRLRDGRLELIQTIDQHNGSVNNLEVVTQDDATLLLSLSSDRTIAIHRLTQLERSQALLCVRIITLKATPLSCALDLTIPGLLSVTTTDKQLQVFQLRSGLLESSIRIIDDDDHMILQDMVLRTVGPEDRPLKLLIGVSNSDKALRVHNGNTGEVICKAGGHSESITSFTVVEENTEDDGSVILRLVTTGLDGTVMLWKLCCQSAIDKSEANDNTPTREARQTPLRKVLSRSRLSAFAASLDSTEWSPLPSPTRERVPFRNTSPDRLRRRTSMTTLINNSPTPVLSPTPRHIIDLSPTSGSSPSPSRRRTIMSRSDSPVRDVVDTTTTSRSIITNLRSFRTKLRNNMADFDLNARNELKLELETTLDVLLRHNNMTDDSSQDNSYFSAVDGLGLQNLTIAEEK